MTTHSSLQLQFCGHPFGVSTAQYVFTKVMSSTVARLLHMCQDRDFFINTQISLAEIFGSSETYQHGACVSFTGFEWKKLSHDSELVKNRSAYSCLPSGASVQFTWLHLRELVTIPAVSGWEIKNYMMLQKRVARSGTFVTH